MRHKSEQEMYEIKEEHGDTYFGVGGLFHSTLFKCTQVCHLWHICHIIIPCLQPCHV